MGCACSGSASNTKYEVVTADGRTIEVTSRTEALAIVRKEGGTWRQKV